MIADDAGFIRQIVREVYETAGHEVVAEAANGIETVTKALELRPDLLILDIVLPDRNGLEVAVEISSQNQQIVMVATSSLDTEWIEENAKLAGCFHFLKKPFTKEELLQVAKMTALKMEKELKHG